MEKTKGYYAFLLRLWKGDSPNDQAWRASLEDVHTHEITGFNNLAALFKFLGTLIKPTSPEQFQSTQFQNQDE
jgi:hypothetical protein